MRLYKIKYLAYTGILFFLTACDGNCKDEIIEKTEWVTTFKSQPIDTLLTYTVLENKTQYVFDTKQVAHSVVIRNDNSQYSNKFSISIYYMIVGDDLTRQTQVFNSDFVEIQPNSYYRFVFSRQAKDVINFNSDIKVNQPVLKVNIKKRVDNLKIENITVNSCDENVSALKEKYKVIKELYTASLKAKGI